MKAHIFREYDIRGVVPEEIDHDNARLLGLAIGTYYQQRGAAKVSVGRDCRLSSPELAQGFSRGLLDSGVDVVDVGMVPTPLLYFSLHHLEVDGGVQVTGSHNPPNFNGFKVNLGEMSLYGKEIQKIRALVDSGELLRGKAKAHTADVVTPYLAHVVRNIQTGPKPCRVVVDGGNGVGGPVGTELYRKLGHEVIPLYCEPDGTFPNHHPDPTIPENLEDLRNKVAETGADLGIAFDGDADRIGVVDQEGGIIWGDQLMILFARDILGRNPGASVIGEVKSSQVMYDDIRAHGGRAIMWKTGHSLIKAKMKEEKALLAGEMSGHIFFGERYFGYDDAIYSGARLLEILSRSGNTLSSLLSDLPRTVTTPEIRIDCPEERKFEIVEAMAKEFKKAYQVIDVDGARVLMEGGWGLIRASNTQPVLVLRFEAADAKRLEEIRGIFMGGLKRYL